MSADTVVVGVAMIDEGRVLAARRVRPPEAAGRWELPGGKVEPGEDLEACAVREIEEELGCTIEVEKVLDQVVDIRPGYVLRVVTAALAMGEPVPREHDAVRWLAGEELGKVDWLEPDLPFLSVIQGQLR
jgi:8-oxo-dGTP diphosphatase